MPVHPPKQRRSQETFDRVLETSTRLLEEAGFEAFTVREVSQRAGVSVGAIYARFGSKEQRLRLVHRHAMDSMRSEHDAVARVDGQPTRPARAVVTLAVGAVADVFRVNERLLSAFMRLHVGIPVGAPARRVGGRARRHRPRDPGSGRSGARRPIKDPLRVLVDPGYTGYVSSEYEGWHWNTESDAFDMVARQQALCRGVLDGLAAEHEEGGSA